MTDRTNEHTGERDQPRCTDDRYRYDDGAYVIGALSPAERTEFERHLAGCDACSGAVASLRPTVRALRSLPAGAAAMADGPSRDAAAPDVAVPDTAVPDTAVPDTLLPGLLRAARRQRRNRLAGLAAVAAGVAAVLAAVLIWTGLGGHQPAGRPMQALLPTPVHATVALEPARWGTEVVLDCRYDAGPGTPRPYDMRVIDRSGATELVGSWTIGPGSSLIFTGGTALPTDRIAAVEVAVPGGPVILRLATG